MERGGPAASITVQLGQDHAVEIEGVVESLRAVDRVLTGHGVANEEDVVRLDLAVDLPQLVHGHLGDVQAPPGVENHGFQQGLLGLANTIPPDIHAQWSLYAPSPP